MYLCRTLLVVRSSSGRSLLWGRTYTHMWQRWQLVPSCVLCLSSYSMYVFVFIYIYIDIVCIYIYICTSIYIYIYTYICCLLSMKKNRWLYEVIVKNRVIMRVNIELWLHVNRRSVYINWLDKIYDYYEQFWVLYLYHVCLKYSLIIVSLQMIANI